MRADLEAFAGLDADTQAFVDDASVTSIIDIPCADPDLAQKWARTVTGALNGRPVGKPLRAEVIYDADRSLLKVVVFGSPSDTLKLLGLVQVWLDQLRP